MVMGWVRRGDIIWDERGSVDFCMSTRRWSPWGEETVGGVEVGLRLGREDFERGVIRLVGEDNVGDEVGLFERGVRGDVDKGVGGILSSKERIAVSA